MAGQMPRKPLQCPNCGANVAEADVRCGYCRAVLSVTACPFCFGPIFRGMKHCPNCGAACDRSAAAADPERPPLPCPRCAVPLTSARIGETRIDECGSCGGIWLDSATFDKVVTERKEQERFLLYPFQPEPSEAQSAAGADSGPARMYVPCPVCGELMNRKNFAGCSGVVMDWCKPHGFWFDRKELQQIIDFVRDGGLQKSRARELAALEAERKRLSDQQFEHNLRQIDRYSLSEEGGNNLDLSFLGIVFAILRAFFK